MVVRHQEGKISTTARKGEYYCVVPVSLNVVDTGNGARTTGLGVGAAVIVNRIDHIFGIKGLTIMKLYALAKLKYPDRGVARCFPAFC